MMARPAIAVTAPGVVKVRLLGDEAACTVIAAILTASQDAEILTASAPYANDREPGIRLYLTVRANKPAQGEGT
jgi:hypothetical protein